MIPAMYDSPNEPVPCCCAFKAGMTRRMLELRRAHPGPSTQWVDHLLGADPDPQDSPLCCMLTALFYYGYCEECTMSVSDLARDRLAPLMGEARSSEWA